MKNFITLSEREILALATSLEEEDERVCADFGEGHKQDFPASAAVFDAMGSDASGHRRRPIDLYRQEFGEHIPLMDWSADWQFLKVGRASNFRSG